MNYEVSFLNDFFSNLSGCEWIAIASSFAIILSQGLSTDEIGILANFFSSLGDNLNILASTKTSHNTQDLSS